jgi:hypothetical protein
MNMPTTDDGRLAPRTYARAATAVIQARAQARRIREELAIAADILTELPDDEVRGIGLAGDDRGAVLTRCRVAIVLLDDVERQLVD